MVDFLDQLEPAAIAASGRSGFPDRANQTVRKNR
jgi:hypothetical protein